MSHRPPPGLSLPQLAVGPLDAPVVVQHVGQGGRPLVLVQVSQPVGQLVSPHLVGFRVSLVEVVDVLLPVLVLFNDGAGGVTCITFNNNYTHILFE